ncbi:MAG: phytanoyl-CoA dioxygenase family protein [Magnetococcales bacterium]|nr:phytanoyl-CoA dioxygenase family protein [Magnetococcales bacterium]
MIISPKEIHFFHENGYLHIPNFLSSERCDTIMEGIEKRAEGHYHNYLHLHEEVPEVQALITDSKLLAVCDSVNDHRMVPVGSIFFFCKPNNPLEAGSLPHQEVYAVKAEYGAYLVAAVAFDDADEENGSFIVYPGSHTMGKFPFTTKKNFDYREDGQLQQANPIGPITDYPKSLEKTKIQLTYKRGDLLLVHDHVLHYADRNTSKDRWRRKIYMHFIKDGHPFWPGWNARRQVMDRPPRFTSE